VTITGNVLKQSPLRISPSLVLLPFIFGWVLNDNRSGVSVNHVAVINIELCQEVDLRDSQFRRFWSLEAMGITDTFIAPPSIKDTAMLSRFSDSFHIEDGRAVVSLPKKEHATLQKQQRAKTLQVPDEKVPHHHLFQNNLRK